MGGKVGEAADVSEEDGDVAVLLDVDAPELLVRVVAVNVLLHVVGNVFGNDREQLMMARRME
jgi:hypothetical protein